MAQRSSFLRLDDEKEILTQLGISPELFSVMRADIEPVSPFTQLDPLLTAPTIQGKLKSQPRRVPPPRTPGPFTRAIPKKRVGLQVKSKKKKTQKVAGENRRVRSALLLSPESLQTAIGSLLGIDAFEEQSEAAETLTRIAAAQAGGPSPVDLSPLFALVDAQTGSNFAQTITRPEKPGTRQRRIIEGIAAGAREKRNLTNTLLDGLSALKIGEIQSTVSSKTLNELVRERVDPKLASLKGGLTANQIRQEMKDMRAILDKRFVIFNKQTKELNGINIALTEGTFQTLNPILSSIANIIGNQGGRISDKDVALITGTTMEKLINNVRFFFANNPATTKVPERILRPLKLLVRENNLAILNDMNGEVRRIRSTFKASEDQLASGIDVDAILSPSQKRINDFARKIGAITKKSQREAAKKVKGK